MKLSSEYNLTWFISHNLNRTKRTGALFTFAAHLLARYAWFKLT